MQSIATLFYKHYGQRIHNEIADWQFTSTALQGD